MPFQICLIEHGLLAAAIQVTVGLLTRNWWAGAALASGYFLGREIAQAEYRWIEEFGQGVRAAMPWQAVFDQRVWHNADQVADWLGPVVTNLAITLLALRRAKRQSSRKHDDTAADGNPPHRS